jgi:mevalonate kinase
MNQNHILLQQIGVSCPELDRLVSTAQSAGAMGAKLSGAGGGGNMIALTSAEKSAAVAAALQATGAARIIVTTLKKQA